MTVKIVDNIPAGDLGTHLPKLHNEPEQVAKALTDGATPDKISNPSAGTPNKLLKVVE